MVGVVLILLSDKFSTRTGPKKLLGAVRRLALVAALGYLLLIPLQISANVTSTGNTVRQAFTVLRKAKGDVDALAKAESPAAMDAVLARMPSNIRQATLALKADSFESRRDQLVDLLKPQVDRAVAAGGQASRERWFTAMFGSTRFTLVALTWAIGYAAVASQTATGPSLLQSLGGLRQALANRARRPKAPPRSALPKTSGSDEQIMRWKQAKREAAQREAAKRKARAQKPGRTPPLGAKGRQRPGGRRSGAVMPEWFENRKDPPGNDE
jgi:hypothetical protein